MTFAGKNRIRFFVFALLLVYATTTDFMATTAGMVAGQDCDHPTLRVEHKCVTSSAGEKVDAQHFSLATIHADVAVVAPIIHDYAIDVSLSSALGRTMSELLPLSPSENPLPLRR